MNPTLSRGIGYGLGTPAGGAAAVTPWWLAGGVSAANVVAVYQPIGAASLAASYTNLANPGTYDAAPVQTPGWDTTNGWTRNGAGSGVLNTGVVPAASSWSLVVRFSGHDTGSYKYLSGRLSSGRSFFMAAREAATHSFYNYQGLLVGAMITSGVMAMAGQTGFLNGTADAGEIPGAWTGVANVPIYVLGVNALAESAWPTTVKIQALSIYKVTLTAPQVAAISSAMSLLA